MRRITAVTAVAVTLVAGFIRRRHLVGAPLRFCARERACHNPLHLPYAPGLPQRPSRQLSDLRHAHRGETCGRRRTRRRPRHCRMARCR